MDNNGTYKGALAMITDITERKLLEQKLIIEQLERQKNISRAEIIAQEKERSDIGVELHDNVNQLLAAGKLYLSYSLSLKENYQPLIIKTQEYLSMAIDEIRKLSKALVGPAIENPKGLIDSISELLNDISIIKEIEFNFNHDEFNEETTEGGLKLVIYRIIQEQINNILKHAEATSVKIELANTTMGLQLIISDNGKGFDTNAHRPGIGLKNIKNRANIYDGTAEIISSPGNGCNMKIIFKECR